jgi:polysaccharide export outer membrane protein
MNPKVATLEQLNTFENAGPLRPGIDADHIVSAKIPAGPYRLAKNDVLEVYMPAIIQAASAEDLNTTLQKKTEPILCRVDMNGKINLPVAGEISAAGKTLSELDALIASAYYPKYTTTRPTVVTRIAEYSTVNVTVIGAVKEPGIYQLRSDEMSLVGLLMKSGGILEDGAGCIRIRHPGTEKDAKTFVLPVKGLNIPFADVVVEGGDTIEVERLNPEIFTVIGLVAKPGAYPYPPGVQYNLQQALSFAGWVDELADPEYVKVYRQTSDGTVVDATFKLSGTTLTDASNVIIKPGDVIAVEQTPLTRTRLLMAEIFRINTGIGVNAGYGYRREDGNVTYKEKDNRN